MKRFGVNRLYIDAQTVLPQQIIEVDEAGKVICFYSLTEEFPATEWLGGTALLSSRNDWNSVLPDAPSALAKRLCATKNSESNCYAWHLALSDEQDEFGTRKPMLRWLR